MKKYIPVFGDQSLFDGAPEDAIAIRVNDYKKITYYHHNEEDLKSKSMQDLHAIPIVAMRRIIKEPKRWTVEDQKAGRLPEVGAHFLTEGNLAEFIGLSHAHNNWCFRRLDGEHGIQTANKDWFAPIETPEEKAARLKDEWCKSAAKKLKNLEHTSTLTSIYDAMLSGELSTPIKSD